MERAWAAGISQKNLGLFIDNVDRDGIGPSTSSLSVKRSTSELPIQKTYFIIFWLYIRIVFLFF